ncbi:LlaJI family restriction endonuclease [Helcococcus ovis]|uniref:LlaJI family restriction endonuclease n=1 Tax=Helcococcus ovis TaxID=72026 RepID=UPI00106F52DB|nr:LlaJI family restriction endonuclease [Helcococcus ovis]TFF65022.1 LlaJI family restriction endonuclease [Helcococcus ovis]
MKTVVLQELKPYSKGELQKIFALDEAELVSVLEKLSIKNIVRGINNGLLDDLTIEELFDEDIFNTVSFESMYVFKYVGIISVKNICLVVYPKYMNTYKDDKNFSKFKQIISVVRKYNGKSIQQGFNNALETDNFNLVSLTLELLKEYYEHGLYRSEKEVIEINGEGEILWDKTINENTAYFFNDSPFYLDLFTNNYVNNEDDFFRMLHSLVITEACKTSEDILNIIGVEGIHLNNSSISALGSIEFLVQRINQELSQQFVTYKIKALNLMKSYLTKNDYTTAADNISFVGTISFNMVWEDVCSVVMGDCVNRSLKEMGLKYSKTKGDSTLLSEVIPIPKWIYISEEGTKYTHSAKQTLVPDLVVVDKDNHSLSIYDAKYYKIRLDEKGVLRQPGVGDIDKQYLYELAYKKFAEENNLIISQNAFIMPSDGIDEKKLGMARMDIFHGLVNPDLHDIEVILKPCEVMYEIYLTT